MVFATIELSLEMVTEGPLSFEEGVKRLKPFNPSRWENPAVVAVDDEAWKKFEQRKESGEGETAMFGELEDIIVVVPDKKWGYGNRYRDVAVQNRERLGLTF